MSVKKYFRIFRKGLVIFSNTVFDFKLQHLKLFLDLIKEAFSVIFSPISKKKGSLSQMGLLGPKKLQICVEQIKFILHNLILIE